MRSVEDNTARTLSPEPFGNIHMSGHALPIDRAAAFVADVEVAAYVGDFDAAGQALSDALTAFGRDVLPLLRWRRPSLNAAKNLKGEGDSTWQHFDDTIYGGDFLANQPPVKAMCDAAPGIIDLLDRMGVTFNRTPEGLPHTLGGAWTAHAGIETDGAVAGEPNAMAALRYAADGQVAIAPSNDQVYFKLLDVLGPLAAEFDQPLLHVGDARAVGGIG